MRKLLAAFLWCLSLPALAQFVPGQVLTAAQLNSQFALYAPLAGATFSGNVVMNGTVSGTGVTTLLGPYLLSATAASTYAPLNNPTFTGTVTVPNNSFALTKLATQAANTLVANVTAGSAAPTAASLPSCSTANSALQYTSGTGLSCSTNTAIISGTTFTGASGLSYSAPNFTINDTVGTNRTAITYSSNGTTVWDEGFAAASPHNYSVCRYTAGVFTDCPISISQANGSMTFVGGINSSAIGATTASTGAFTTLSATGLITPSTTNGIKGTTAADSANAGSVGEVLTASVASGSAVSLTTATAANVTSISLTAGDWDVWGQVSFLPAGTTVMISASGFVSTASATFPANPNTVALTHMPLTYGTGQGPTLQTGTLRVNVSSTTTVFLEARSDFNTSTNAAYGYIVARRRR